MKPGSKVWIRVGLDRAPVQGVLESVDMIAGEGQVVLVTKDFTRKIVTRSRKFSRGK